MTCLDMRDMEFPLDAKIIAREINVPLEEWPGNCHGIAGLILEKMPIEGMRLVRGHFDGPISRESIYRGGVQQHSWLRLEDGRILDPTRWCMTQPNRPFIYLGVNDAYDEAGIMLSEKSRAAWGGSLGAIGQKRPEDRLQERLDTVPEHQRADLSEALGVAPGDLTGFQVLEALSAPVEHLESPEAFYRAAEACGLKSLIKADNWIRVMEPERVTPRIGTNFFYTAPEREELSDAQILFQVFCRFLSIEHRGERIHDELAEYGYKLEDLWESLNDLEKYLKVDPDLTWTRPERDLLCYGAMDLLGKGFGEELRVERFADSLGMDRDRFDRALREFGAPAGLDIDWIWPPRRGGQELDLADSPEI